MKKVIVITDVDFWHEGAGHRMRIAALIDYLSKCSFLTVVYIGISDQDSNFIAKHYNIDFFELGQNEQMGRDVAGERLQLFTQKQYFDAVIVEYIHNTYFLNFIENFSILILDTHDIISESVNGFNAFNYPGLVPEMSRDLEIELMGIYDYVIAICTSDYLILKNMIDPKKILICPHPVKEANSHFREKAKVIGYVASEHLPNVDAIEFFLTNCWPVIISNADVELHIYGNINKKLKLINQDKVHIKGFYGNLENVYNELDVIINPVRFGSGIKIKSLEALAHGLPLVTTSHGARGIPNLQPPAFIIADSASEIINSVLFLVNNASVRRQISKSAIKLINHEFTTGKCFKPLLIVLSKV